MNEDKALKIALTQNRFLEAKYYDYYSDHRKSNGVYFWGNDNLAPNKLYELRYSSPTHASLLDLKMFMLDSFDIIGEQIEIDFYTKYNKLSIEDLVKNLIKDYVIYNQFFVKMIKTQSNIRLIDYIPTQNCRYSIELDEDNDVKDVIVSKDWSNVRLQENRRYKGKIYKNEVDLELDENLIYNYRDEVYVNRYQVPNYFSALNNIMLEEEISKFNLANTKHGWAPRVIVTTFGNLSTQEQMIQADMIDSMYRGSENAGRVVYLTAIDPEHKPLIEPISLNLNDDSYVNLVTSTKDYILSAHKCTSPALAGLAINGGFEGQGSAMLAAFKIYDQLTINSYRLVLEREINKILKLSGYSLEIKMNERKINIENDEANNN